MQKEERFRSIMLLKCFSALLITNSHFNKLYPPSISFLAFGGFFGNTLFFLISGYLLSNCDRYSFPKWYVRRVLRIYIPYVIILPFLLFEECTRIGLNISVGGVFEWLFPIRKYHFIPSIIVLYPIYYILSKLNNKNKVPYQVSLAVLVGIQLVYYFFVFDNSYAIDADFRFIPMLSYLQIMIIGGIMRRNNDRVKRYRVISILVTVIAFLLYVYQVFRPFQRHLEIIQLYAGLMFSCGIACVVIGCEDKIPVVKIVSTIENLTLEIYLVQFMLIDAFRYYAFPLDIGLCVISIVATAYCLHFLVEKVKMAFSAMK